MAPKSSPEEGSKAQRNVHLSQREMEILSFAWQCFIDHPRIDFEKLAKVAPFKNAATARACFFPVKKKVMAAGESSEASTNTKPRRKRAADDQMASAFTKKTKSAAKSSRKVIPKTEEDDAEKPLKKKKKTWAGADEKDAEIMSGLLGFDVKKELEKDSGDENEA